MTPSSHLVNLVSQPSERALPAGIRAVGRALQEQYGGAAVGILFYGSCLRAGSDRESLVDCYVLVENYFLAYQSKSLAFANWILPPNVFYLGVPFSDRVIRVKYGVLSMADFERSVSSRWFHSYFWARFAQPAVLLSGSIPEIKNRVFNGLAQAVNTFLKTILPRMKLSFTAEQLWRTGLMLTYGAELRAEPNERVQTLWAHNQNYYEQITHAVLITHPSIRFEKGNVKTRYRAIYSTGEQLLNSMGWMIRTFQGKILSILRLMKAAFTFSGGVDYLIWKIERHSGVKIELTPAQRRHPILTGLATFWRLYRQGAFR